MSTSLKRFILSIFLFLVFGCTTTQPLKEAAIQNSSNANTSIISSSKTNVRSPAADNYFAPRDIKESPYRDIQLINYEQLKSSLIQYISSRPAWVPFQNQEQRWEWASRHAQSAPQFFKILPYQSDTSDAALMQKIKENHPEITRKFGWVTRTSWFKNRKASRLFAYEIFYKNTHNKPSILIWAKEHGDELSTSEFTTELAKFFLLHLQGKGNSELNEVIQNLFSKINVIIVPDMTPDKSFETFKNKTSTREDFNGFHQLLQPFNYDSENPDDYVAAPEASFLKKLILDNDNLALAVDIHSPFGASVITAPANTVAENNRFLIAEANHVSDCMLNLRRLKISNECKSGQFIVTHPQISGGIENAPSFFHALT